MALSFVANSTPVVFKPANPGQGNTAADHSIRTGEGDQMGNTGKDRRRFVLMSLLARADQVVE
jgi:hypothetical protein